MVDRQRVLVAVDDGTDVERALAIALTLARGQTSGIDVVRVVPRRVGRDGGELRRDDTAHTSAVRAAIASLGAVAGDMRHVTLHGAPRDVITAYAALHGAALLVIERDYGSPPWWRHGRTARDLARESPVPVLVVPPGPRPDGPETAPRQILVPVDFSVASARAVKTAAELGRAHGAVVTLVHALEDMPHRLVFGGGEAVDVVRQLPARARIVSARLRHHADRLGLHDPHLDVVTGSPSRAILDIAACEGAHLIVMGVGYRSRISRMLSGSTLHRVLQEAAVPVLVIPVVAGALSWPEDPAAVEFPPAAAA